MKKEEFYEEARAYLTKKGAKIVEVTKNNGLKLTGASLEFIGKEIEDGKTMVPTIYLEYLYEDFKENEPDSLEDFLEEAIRKAAQTPMPSFNTDPESLKEKIMPMLVNKNTNKELLEQIPHRDYVGDIAIIYKAMWHGEESGSALIRNSFIEGLKMSEDDLYRLSMANLFLDGPQAIPMTQIMCELSGMEPEELPIGMMDENPMYVVTNKARCNGSGAILSPLTLEKLANELDSNLFMFPSSIHEWIVIKENDELEEFQDMVRDINATEVSPSDFLSNNVFYYDKETKQVSVAA